MKMVSFIKLDFDKRTKVLMIISIIISISIIIYSFYNICVKNIIGNKSIIDKKEGFSLEDILNINSYEWEGTVHITSNKNDNQYEIREISDIIKNNYRYELNGMVIDIKENEISIKKQGIDYEYVTSEMALIRKENIISFSTIIELINKIQSNEINGEIKQSTENNIETLSILFKDNTINVSKISVKIDCVTNTIIESIIYNDENNECVDIKYKNFQIKN